MTSATGALRIGNMSASRADRASATAELLDAGAPDVLVLDMLSDEAVLQLAEERETGGPGYEAALLDQLAGCLDRVGGEDGVRIVTNAGALDPEGLAARVRALGEERSRRLRVAYLQPGLVPPGPAGRPEVGDRPVDVAVVRHGAGGVTLALESGADVVVTGRVSREALVLGAAAAYHGWTSGHTDALAGAVAAGHVLSGGPGATGVSAGSTDVTRTADPVTGGYPIAEIAADGTCVVTKHPSALGSVTTGTVTDQLLDGVTGPRYAAPDVVLRLDSVRVVQEGTDRVRLSGARGEPAPPRLEVVGLVREDGRVCRVTGQVDRATLGHEVVLDDGSRHTVAGPVETAPVRIGGTPSAIRPTGGPGGRPMQAPLGSVAGVRLGVVGEGLNLAVWTWEDGAFQWLREAVDVALLGRLLPELDGARLERWELPNLRAVNTVVTAAGGHPLPADLDRRLAAAVLEVPSELLEVDP